MNFDHNIDEYAVIEVKDGIVHLQTSWNPDAACCNDDITWETVQREDYDSDGWNEPKDNPKLVSDFWGVWTDWNGRMCGGIWLDDEDDLDGVEEEIDSHPTVSPADIPNLPDGVYSVAVEIS